MFRRRPGDPASGSGADKFLHHAAGGVGPLDLIPVAGGTDDLHRSGILQLGEPVRVMLMSLLSDTRNMARNVTAIDREAFDRLKEIADIADPDENVIYDFHMDHPGAFTHQGCAFPDFANYPPVPRDEGWLDQTEGFFHPAINPGGYPVNYSGEGEDLAEIRKVLKMQYEAIYARNFPCVCGEFGIFSEAADHGGIQWVEDVTDCLDEGEVSYCYFSMRWDSPRNHFNIFPQLLAQNFQRRLAGRN